MDPLTVQRLVAEGMEWALMAMPLAAYFLFLGLVIHRRSRPTVLRGDWNTFWLLLATSGFLLIGPPSWIASPLLLIAGQKAYWLAYGGYVLVLVCGCYFFIRRQRRSLVIFNLDPALFAEMLPKLLSDLDIPYVVTPGRVAFAEGKLVLDIETSFLFHNVLLSWQGEEPDLEAKIGAALRTGFLTVETGDHSGGMILTFCAIILCSFILFATVLFVVLLVTLHVSRF